MRSKIQSFPTMLAMSVILQITAVCPAAQYSWSAAVSGSWSVAANWDPPQVPGVGDDVIIDEEGSPYTVTVDTPEAIKTLSLLSPDATLAITGGGQLNVSELCDVWGGRIESDGGLLRSTGGYSSLRGGSGMPCPFRAA